MNRLLAIRAFKSSRPGGGAGVRRRVRVFLYYHHTPHNFFRHKRLTAPHRTASCVPPVGIAPRAWHGMHKAVIDPRSVGVALCSVRYACCRMHKGLSRFYAVTRQAMIVTRDIHLTPAAMPINVYWSGTSRRASILCIRHAVLLLCRDRGTRLR